MAFICGNQILAYVFYESLSVPILFRNGKYFPFQIFFGTESDSYITKCLISVQHSSSLISSIKKRILQFLKEFCCPCWDLNPGLLTSHTSALPLNLYKFPRNQNLICSYKLWTQQSQCAHQGYNSIGWLLRTFFLENSRPWACYFQWNSWKLINLVLRVSWNKGIFEVG